MTNLALLVNRTIYLGMPPNGNWTTIKPQFERGSIEKDTILLLDYLYDSDGYNFNTILPNESTISENKPELFKDELHKLLMDNILSVVRN